MPASASPRRVLILSAEVGEGHAAAARALRAALIGQDAAAEIVIVDGMQSLGRLVRWSVERAYRAQLRRAPATYGLLYWLVLRCSLIRALGRAVIVACGARGLARLIDAHAPDLVVSTYPATTAVLGALRRRGRLDLPTAAVVSDFTGVALWVDPNVDRHLVMYAQSFREAAALVGAGRVTCVAPLIDPRFLAAASAAECRRTLGLPSAGRVIVISGGGWAVGDLPAAIKIALAQPDVHVLCLTGRDREAERRLNEVFADESGLTVLGFTERMPELLCAADVLIHTTAGMTALEALACDCPVVAFDPPPGHPRLNSRAMARAGLLTNAEGRDALCAALQSFVSGPRPAQPDAPTGRPDAASTLLAARPLPPVRRALAATGLRIAGAAALAITAATGVGVLGDEELRLAALTVATGFAASTLRTALPLPLGSAT